MRQKSWRPSTIGTASLHTYSPPFPTEDTNKLSHSTSNKSQSAFITGKIKTLGLIFSYETPQGAASVLVL